MDVREEDQMDDISSLPSSRMEPRQIVGRGMYSEGDVEDGAKRDRPLPIYLKVL